jgi:hypothetical protein
VFHLVEAGSGGCVAVRCMSLNAAMLHLCCCRCSFEAGAAPVFHLVEAGSGGWLVGRGSRKTTLQVGHERCS